MLNKLKAKVEAVLNSDTTKVVLVWGGAIATIIVVSVLINVGVREGDMLLTGMLHPNNN
jgi:hypothetical protein